MEKVIILIFTYDRFNSLTRLIEQLVSQSTKYEYKIVVCDDSSPGDEYINMDYFNNNNVEIIRTNENNGKFGYWKTVNYAFNHIKNINFDYLIQLDDDYEICDNFIDLSVDFFIKQTTKHINYCAMSLHLNGNQDGVGNRWKCGNSWVDGGAIYNNNIINCLNFQINEISKERWSKNSKLSSGVWQQVSNRINELGFIIIKPTHSFLNHNDNNLSKMNFNLHGDRIISSYNFIGDTKSLELTIYEPIITKNLNTPTPKKKSSGAILSGKKETQPNTQPNIPPIEPPKKEPELKPIINTNITSTPNKLHVPNVQPTISKITNDTAIGKLRKNNLRISRR